MADVIEPINNSILKRVIFSFVYLLFLIYFSSSSPIFAAELSGRFSVLALQSDSESKATRGDQQSLRLMFEHIDEGGDASSGVNPNASIIADGLQLYVGHLKLRRQHTAALRNSSLSTSFNHWADFKASTDLFRYKSLNDQWQDACNLNRCTVFDYDLDRLFYQYQKENHSLTVGRQAIDWGVGRFWQPLNVFGAFSPVDIDTDYKPGIDAVLYEGYPSDFSTLSVAYVFTASELEYHNSFALHYRQQLGSQAELTLLTGRILDQWAIGAAFEDSWQGMGWRLEGIGYHKNQQQEGFVFTSAGIDYRFEQGTRFSFEWYHHSKGGEGSMYSNPWLVYGLQPYFTANVLGFSAQHELSPLWQGSYTVLTGVLGSGSEIEASWLHQVSLTYSMTDETDLVMAFVHARGEQIEDASSGQSQRADSEFGSLPDVATIRLSVYF